MGIQDKDCGKSGTLSCHAQTDVKADFPSHEVNDHKICHGTNHIINTMYNMLGNKTPLNFNTPYKSGIKSLRNNVEANQRRNVKFQDKCNLFSNQKGRHRLLFLQISKHLKRMEDKENATTECAKSRTGWQRIGNHPSDMQHFISLESEGIGRLKLIKKYSYKKTEMQYPKQAA